VAPKRDFKIVEKKLFSLVQLLAAFTIWLIIANIDPSREVLDGL
jgi:hypothetical protein